MAVFGKQLHTTMRYWLVCALTAALVAAADAQYGPGTGPWEVDAPEKHGITAEAMLEASALPL